MKLGMLLIMGLIVAGMQPGVVSAAENCGADELQRLKQTYENARHEYSSAKNEYVKTRTKKWLSVGDRRRQLAAKQESLQPQVSAAKKTMATAKEAYCAKKCDGAESGTARFFASFREKPKSECAPCQ